MTEHLVGITHTEELLAIFRLHDMEEVPASKITEAGLLFIVKKSEPDPAWVQAFAKWGMTLNPTYNSAFIGYKWGDQYQDDKVQKYANGHTFYRLTFGEYEGSFEKYVVEFLNALYVSTLKKNSPVAGYSPLLSFADSDSGNAFAEFELNYSSTDRTAGEGSYYLAYPYDKLNDLIK